MLGVKNMERRGDNDDGDNDDGNNGLDGKWRRQQESGRKTAMAVSGTGVLHINGVGVKHCALA